MLRMRKDKKKISTDKEKLLKFMNSRDLPAL